MARSGWGIALAGALVAATLPVVVVTGAQAGVSGVDRGAGSPEAAVAVARVQPRLVSAPESQWAILATSPLVQSPRQPAVLGTREPNLVLTDDTVYVPGAAGSRNLSDAIVTPFAPTLGTQGTALTISSYSGSGYQPALLDWTASQADDTIWVSKDTPGSNSGSTVIQINGRTNTWVQSSNFPARTIWSVAVKDDSVFAAYQKDLTTGPSGGIAGIYSVLPAFPSVGSLLTNPEIQPFRPAQMAASRADDTLVLAGQGNFASPTRFRSLAINSRTGTSVVIPMPWNAVGAAGGLETLYLSQENLNGIAAINPRNLDDSQIVSIPGAQSFGGMAAWPGTGGTDDTVFVADNGARAIWVLKGSPSLTVDDSVSFTTYPQSVTIARRDLVYVSALDSSATYPNPEGAALPGRVHAVGVVSGQTAPRSVGNPLTGIQDDSITISLNLPELFTINNSLVTNVYLDDTPVSAFAITDDTALQARVPNLTGGPYSVIVGLNGGNRIKVGEFTYNSPVPPNPPAPAVPSMVPTAQALNGVVGTAVTPSSKIALTNFTMPVTYSIYPPLPAGLFIDPATGVVSGTPTVVYPTTRHWITAATAGNSESAYSTIQVTVSEAPPPPPVTRTLVLNQGERTKGGDKARDRITTTGSSTGISAGTRLTPYIKYAGQQTFSQGLATIVVQADGSFRWTREIRRNRSVTAYVAYEDVKSNEVVWARLA